MEESDEIDESDDSAEEDLEDQYDHDYSYAYDNTWTEDSDDVLNDHDSSQDDLCDYASNAKKRKATQSRSRVVVKKRRMTPKSPKPDLLRMLRKFSAKAVKISQKRRKWARGTAAKHLEEIRKRIPKYCKIDGCIFSHFEFTGSFFEHLKIKEADELDVMVAFKAKTADFEIEEVIPGYVRLKVKDHTQFSEVTKEGYLYPQSVRSWFFGLIQKSINGLRLDNCDCKVIDHGPASTLFITSESKKLSIDLVPAFLFKNKKISEDPMKKEEVSSSRSRHYVPRPPKPLPENETSRDLPIEMLWRQSFSLEEKRKLKNVDKKDKGCRQDLVRIVKTIIKNDSTLSVLSSYHIKSAFFHYNFGQERKELDWSNKKLLERFLGLLEYLRDRVREKRLSNYFVEGLDLFEELKNETLENIEGRLTKLIKPDSVQELVKALTP